MLRNATNLDYIEVHANEYIDSSLDAASNRLQCRCPRALPPRHPIMSVFIDAVQRGPKLNPILGHNIKRLASESLDRQVTEHPQQNMIAVHPDMRRYLINEVESNRWFTTNKG